MSPEAVTLIGLICTITGAGIGVMTFARRRDKEIKKEAERRAETQVETNLKLNHIIKGVDDMKIDFKTNERAMQEFGKSLVRVDESTKQAHKRLDKIDEKLEKI